MYTQREFIDLRENTNFADSWLLADGNSFPSQHPNQSSLPITTNSAANSGLDPSLVKVITEIFPLVQTLMDENARSSFPRRGSMVYTKTPSKESLARKVTDPKGRNVGQSISTKKKRDHGYKDQIKNSSSIAEAGSFSMLSSRALSSEKDQEDFVSLKEQVQDLQRKLLEKDELLQSVENSKVQLNSVNAKMEELKRQNVETESSLKSAQVQLSDAKMKLADKQAALEKSQWEALEYHKKVEKLQKELDSVQGEISSFSLLVEGLIKEEPALSSDDFDVKPYELEHLPDIGLDDLDEEIIEKARKVYLAAVAAAKEKRDEESIAAASSARLHLQSFVFRSMKSSTDLALVLTDMIY